MKLLKSLKPKKRYVLFEIISEEKFTATEVEKTVEEALHNFLGDLGVSKAAPMFVKEKFTNNTFILKIHHKYVDECKSALILIKKIKNKPVILKSIITSGTIKKTSSRS